MLNLMKDFETLKVAEFKFGQDDKGASKRVIYSRNMFGRISFTES
jgi:hypothetical protein